MIDVKSPKTNTFADGLIERTSPMLDEIESKTIHKDKEDGNPAALTPPQAPLPSTPHCSSLHKPPSQELLVYDL